MNQELKTYLLENHYNDYALIYEDVAGNIKYTVASFKESLLKQYYWLLKQRSLPFTCFIVLVHNDTLGGYK